jgi:hypothetical protein
MSKSNVKLTLSFEMDITVPEAFLKLDHTQLCKSLSETLGGTVLQGLPSISAKQLSKAGIRLDKAHHHLDAANIIIPALPRKALVAAGPHLTDEELEQLARKAGGRTFESDEAMYKALRRAALALVADYRLVPCTVEGQTVAGQTVTLEARLNLTNGSVIVLEKDRQHRLQMGQPPLPVSVETVPTPMKAAFSGHTLSGPVLAVQVHEIAVRRDPLLAIWKKQPNL